MSEYVSVSIPEALARRARELARERRRSLDTVIAEVLDEALPPGETPEPADGEDEVVLREMQAYTALYPALRASYPGQHVAVVDGQLVDHDGDPEALYRRVIARYPDRFVWLTKVEDEPLATLNFRSPRLISVP
ncbi:protein of unknown function [Candidatus Promineifilum breve]|uniref:DUF5678 domain-containing protein n=1 Tax=Candidatus Promineifilum breve TaxID=1806508 RepID=A0A160T2Z7_9CHLR|nr:DUF5678 domain-containing protein [Candidatus Promineifilum breve]CUS04531.2 protein of unknown function [Candidatus Promineifilum breve]